MRRDGETPGPPEGAVQAGKESSRSVQGLAEVGRGGERKEEVLGKEGKEAAGLICE